MTVDHYVYLFYRLIEFKYKRSPNKAEADNTTSTMMVMNLFNQGMHAFKKYRDPIEQLIGPQLPERSLFCETPAVAVPETNMVYFGGLYRDISLR